MDAHLFSAAADILDLKKLVSDTIYTSMDKNLGIEIDFTWNKTFNKQFSVQCGYSHYLTTETIAYLKGVLDYKGDGYTDSMNNWAYVMLIFKPNFTK